MSESDAAAREVAEAMERINRAWMDGHPQDLVQYFHPDVVAIAPGFVGRVRGRDAFAKSFSDFLAAAVVGEFSRGEYEVDVMGRAALVTVTFTMTYSLGEKTYASTGRDVWGFSHDDAEWLAVWRMMLDVEEREV
jgi:uncharacterized protein (TIGR02246 family)